MTFGPRQAGHVRAASRRGTVGPRAASMRSDGELRHAAHARSPGLRRAAVTSDRGSRPGKAVSKVASMRATSRCRRSLGVGLSLSMAAILVMTVVAPASAATVGASWKAKIGSAGVNGTATIQAYTTGSGSLALKLAKLRAATYLPVTISRGRAGRSGRRSSRSRRSGPRAPALPPGRRPSPRRR